VAFLISVLLLMEVVARQETMRAVLQRVTQTDEIDRLTSFRRCKHAHSLGSLVMKFRDVARLATFVIYAQQLSALKE
jgi:hypothetical protein